MNPRPLGPEPSALPAALLPVTIEKKTLSFGKGVARVTGLEPVISGVTGQRDNQLRYTRVMVCTIKERMIRVNMEKAVFIRAKGISAGALRVNIKKIGADYSPPNNHPRCAAEKLLIDVRTKRSKHGLRGKKPPADESAQRIRRAAR